MRKLYLPAGARHFRSRQAYGLAYETEHLDDRERAWRRVRKCRRQLGERFNALEHREQFARLAAACRAAPHAV